MAPDHAPDRVSGGFAELLRRYRRAAGLTQTELAERAAVGVRTVRDLERGRSSRPQRTTIQLLATALNLSGPTRTDFLASARGRSGPFTSSDTSPGTGERGTGPPGSDTVRTEAGPHPSVGLGLPEPPELVGRDRDVDELVAMLTPGPRLVRGVVSLVGLAGVGKTALALTVARRMRDQHPGGTNGIVVTEGSTEGEYSPSSPPCSGWAGRATWPVGFRRSRRCCWSTRSSGRPARRLRRWSGSRESPRPCVS